MKIVVLGGGLSRERQVSLVTSVSVCKALRKAGHKAVFVDMFLGLENYNGSIEQIFDEPDGLCGEISVEKTEPDIEAIIESRKFKSPSRLGINVLEVCKAADCVFLGLHGEDGEDGKIQATFDLMGIKYTGSDYLSSGMAMNKAVTKKIMNSVGVLTPEWKEITYKYEDIPELIKNTDAPCAVKVVNGGSSIGVFLPETQDELKDALVKSLKYGNTVIIEEIIKGREMTQPVLGDAYLDTIEIIPPDGGTFDYVSKYQSGNEGATELCPAPITKDEHIMMGEAALKLHKALGLSVYSRTDFILDDKGRAWCLEVNTLPGMTPNSLLPKAAALAGLSYQELCCKIVALSLNNSK